MPSSLLDLSFARRIRQLALCLGLTLLLAACGGSGDTVAGVGSGGTGAYTVGPISGFGSIFVNGVEFDDSTAQLQDEDGRPLARSGNPLRLGVTVAVDSAPWEGAAGAQRAAASLIRIGSEIVGPVTQVDVPNGRFTVLGQVVQVAGSTAFDDRLGGLAGLGGQVVQVYGLPGAAGSLVATRVEPAGDGGTFKLRGLVSQVDRAAGTLHIGAATLVAPQGLPPAVQEGAVLRVTLGMQPDGSGRWVIVAVGGDALAARQGRDIKLEGLVTAFTDVRHFSVNGIPVDASALPAQGGVQLGARLEVAGRLSDGIVQASSIELKADPRDNLREFDVLGVVTALDRTAQTLVVQGQTIGFGGARIDGGSAADLAVGRGVEVKARLSLNGTRLEATRIKLSR